MRKALVLSVAIAAVLLAGPAVARADQCFIATSGLAFGAYDVLATGDLTSSGNVGVDCNQGGGTVQLSLSSGTSGNGQNRVMRTASGATLAYRLYTDASRTTPWLDTTVVTFTPMKRVAYPVRVYGAVFALQDVDAGSYGDSLTVTVSF